MLVKIHLIEIDLNQIRKFGPKVIFAQNVRFQIIK